MTERTAASGQQLRRLWLIAFAYRFWISAVRPVPAEDGVNYLWMAEQFASLRFSLGLEEVFPPLWPLLISPWIALGLDPYRAGQLAAALCGATGVVLGVRLFERVFPRESSAGAGYLLAFAPLSSRYGALVYSEPAFGMVACAGVLAGLSGRFAWCGVLSGAAFWIRPEGALVAVAFALTRRWRGLIALGPLGVLVLGLGWWRASAAGLPFDLAPKWAFNLARQQHEGLGVESLAHFVSHLGTLGLQWFEAFYLPGGLAVLGFWALRRHAVADERRSLRPLWVLLIMAVIVIATFLPRRRFLVAWTFAVIPFALLGLRLLPQRGRWPVLLAAVVSSGLSGRRLADSNRYAEREVAEFLAERLEPGERIAGDLSRMLYFAGQRPPPPKHSSSAELIEAARQPGVRYVVLRIRRPTAAPVISGLAGSFEPATDLPFEISAAAERRGVTVLRRVR